MKMQIDQSVYPDRPAPVAFADDFERADYLHRVCSAFDFGIPPDPGTLAMFASWRHVFDAFPLGGSPAYHALRSLFRWEAAAKLPRLSDPLYIELDRQEDRTDPCEHLI